MMTMMLIILKRMLFPANIPAFSFGELASKAFSP